MSAGNSASKSSTRTIPPAFSRNTISSPRRKISTSELLTRNVFVNPLVIVWVCVWSAQVSAGRAVGLSPGPPLTNQSCGPLKELCNAPCPMLFPQATHAFLADVGPYHNNPVDSPYDVQNR